MISLLEYGLCENNYLYGRNENGSNLSKFRHVTRPDSDVINLNRSDPLDPFIDRDNDNDEKRSNYLATQVQRSNKTILVKTPDSASGPVRYPVESF